MNLTVGEKMVWANVFTNAISQGRHITDAAMEASNAVLALREVPKIVTWERVKVDERQKFFAVNFAQSMLHDS